MRCLNSRTELTSNELSFPSTGKKPRCPVQGVKGISKYRFQTW